MQYWSCNMTLSNVSTYFKKKVKAIYKIIKDKFCKS